MANFGGYPTSPEETYPSPDGWSNSFSYSGHGQDMRRELSNCSKSSVSSIYGNLSPTTPSHNMDESYCSGLGGNTTYFPAELNTADEDGGGWFSQTSFTSGVPGYYDHGDTLSYNITPKASLSPIEDEDEVLESSSTVTYSHTEESSPPTYAADSSHGVHVCLAPQCDSRGFKRKADLERHMEHKHRPKAQKKQLFCDYSKCPRAAEAFHRMDHFRDHYRDYHHEDIPRKNGHEGSDWYKKRQFSNKWWRCTKCLERKYVDRDGWTCEKDRFRCDSSRRQARGFK